MNRVFLLFLLWTACSCASAQHQSDSALPRVQMKTAMGDIVIEVFADRAPVTASNFLRYVDEARFKNASFYRTVTLQNQPENDVKIEVIQGGLGFEESEGRLPSIRHETTAETGVLHLDGTVSMARDQPGSADAEIFICIGDQPELDFGGRRNPDGQGFAAFGRVVAGMDVVQAIQRQAEEEQMLLEPVLVLSMSRVR